MPIYAYKCATCGHEQDVLQKMSDEPLTVCPSCGATAFSKQVTAAGFQLKGSGWYATDFRDSGKKKEGGAKDSTTSTAPETKTESKDSAAPSPSAASATSTPSTPAAAPAAPSSSASES